MKDDTRTENLRVVELRAENFMRLRAVRIRPDGTVVNITGRNDQGKTSTITAIAWALGGKEFAEAMPLRKGEREGSVSVDLGSLKVTKRVTADNPVPSLIVEYANGSRPRSPQHVLDELRGQLMDPIAFLRGKGAERIEMVQQLFEGFSFDRNERERKAVFDERTAVNRERTRAVAARDAIVLPTGGKPELVDIAALDAQLKAANAANEVTRKRQAGREVAAGEAERHRNAAERLRAEARGLDAKAADLEAKLEAAEALPALIDTSAIITEIGNASARNAAVARFQEWEQRDNEARRLHHQSETMSAEIKRIEKEKADALAGVKLPVEGLTIGEDEVLINGIPWDQLAFSTRLRVSAAVAMALEPKLQVMCIREFGSLLDKDNMALLARIAEDADFQVWIECQTGGPGAIIIEDGEVKNA
jgi:hypothetical protein